MPLKVRVKISWHEAEREAQERRRGACEKRDCAVARRLEVSITSLGRRGARLVGTKCCRRLETKSFIHCDSRCSSKFKFQSGEEGFLCGMDTLQIMTDFEGRVVAVGRQVL